MCGEILQNIQYFLPLVLFSLCAFLLTVVVLCVSLSSYVYLLCVCACCCFTLVAGLLARSQYPEGPEPGHFGTGFSWFPCVYKRMLWWFPTLPVATACFSCSHLELNFLAPYFIFMYMHFNHCHWAVAQWQLIILLLLLLSLKLLLVLDDLPILEYTVEWYFIWKGVAFWKKSLQNVAMWQSN
jgi:hypothetical protein